MTSRVAGMLRDAQQAYYGTEEARRGGGLRGQLQREHGEGWVWLATEAPMALGRRDASAIVRKAVGRL